MPEAAALHRTLRSTAVNHRRRRPETKTLGHCRCYSPASRSAWRAAPPGSEDSSPGSPLDAADNDPVRFLRDVAAALDRLQPGADAAASLASLDSGLGVDGFAARYLWRF